MSSISDVAFSYSNKPPRGSPTHTALTQGVCVPSCRSPAAGSATAHPAFGGNSTSTLRESWLLSGSEVSPWLGEAREVTPGQSLPIPEEHLGGARREKGGEGCHHHQWAAHSVRGALQTGAGTCVEDHRNFEPMAPLQKTKPQSPHLNLRHGPTVVTKCCMRRLSSQHGKGRDTRWQTCPALPSLPLPGHRSPLLHSFPHSVGRIHLGFSPLYPYLQAAIASSSLVWSECGAGRMAGEARSLHRHRGPDSQGLGPAPPRPVLCWENVGLCQSTCLSAKETAHGGQH